MVKGCLLPQVEKEMVSVLWTLGAHYLQQQELNQHQETGTSPLKHYILKFTSAEVPGL